MSAVCGVPVTEWSPESTRWAAAPGPGRSVWGSWCCASRRPGFPEGLRDSKQLTEDVEGGHIRQGGGVVRGLGRRPRRARGVRPIGDDRRARLATRRAFAQLSPDLVPDAVVLDGTFDFVSPPHVPQFFDADGSVEPGVRPTATASMAATAPMSPPPSSPTSAPESAPGSARGSPPPISASDRAPDLGHGAGSGSAPGESRPDRADISAWAPPVHTVIGGDARCASVAAASVLAKVTRDRIMRATSDFYPAFDFERNKGYPSPAHQRALCGYGLSAVHRRSWAFVDNFPGSSPRGPVTTGPAPHALTEGSLGSPRTRSPTMLRRTSSVPPAMRIPGSPSKKCDHA